MRLRARFSIQTKPRSRIAFIGGSNPLAHKATGCELRAATRPRSSTTHRIEVGLPANGRPTTPASLRIVSSCNVLMMVFLAQRVMAIIPNLSIFSCDDTHTPPPNTHVTVVAMPCPAKADARTSGRIPVMSLGRNRSARTPGQAAARWRSAGCPVPGQQIDDLPGRVIGDAGEDVGEVMLRVATVELGGFEKRVDHRGAKAAGIGAGEQVVLAADCDTTPRPLGAVVIESEAAVVDASQQRLPARARSGRPWRVRICGTAGAGSSLLRWPVPR